MKRNLTLKREFSERVRKDIVHEFESGKSTVLELSRMYCVSTTSIYKWIYKYGKFEKQSVQIVEMKNSQSSKIKALEQRIKDLERIVGQKQISLDFYKKMIELADKEYDISIEKNFSTPQSTGSSPIEKK